MRTFLLYDLAKSLANYISYHNGDEDFEKQVIEKVKKINEVVKEK